ncbi:MAG: pantetheine-phosphate adenylyltransferase [Clostridia bacterium]|nr:pantetheine-phosphate adenylyltransferase [Clostridia bacterium]
MKRIGFYAGSFDPFTNGHLHVVKTSCKLFDEVIIGIGINSDKKRRYNQETIKKAIEKTLKTEKITNAKIITYDNFSVDVANKYNCTFLIRGIRNGMDYDYEESIAMINEEVSGMDTIYIRAGKLGAISSSMVVELIKHNKDVSKYLPKDILDCVHNSI